MSCSARFSAAPGCVSYQLDGAAGLGRDLGDAAPHGAGANYSHICKIYFHGRIMAERIR
jgi:hypothetical protein